MSLRIIAGQARGRRLSAPEGIDVRPSTSRVREAVFNSLHSLGRLDGAHVLDLYAGTGALGLEAVSRGAASVTFVEQAPAALAALRANIEVVGLGDRCRVVAGDVMAELASLSGDYDVALCDPPYGFDGWPEILSQLPAKALVAESDEAVELGPEWDVIKQQRYAGTVVVIACRR